jgi:hypothetical protein
VAKTTPRWTRKRLTAGVLIVVILVLGLIAGLNRMGDARFYYTLAIGIIFGAWYVMRGDLPQRVYDATESRWNTGLHLTRDDDPRNISPKIYLPLIVILILGGIIAFALAVR